MKRDKETLVILIPGFPSSESDSTCLPSQQLFVRAIKELCPSLNIIVLSFQYPYHNKPYRWNDIEVIPFNGQNNGGFARLLRQRKISQTLKKISQQNLVVGILSFWCAECAAVGKRFAGKNNIKHYCWIRGQDARASNRFPARIKPAAGELIALSDFLQDEFERNHHIRPAHVIPAGVDSKTFPASAEKTIDLLAAGSLIPLKQHEIFIEVVAAIKKHIPAIKAVLIGDGPERENLKALINQYDLAENLELTGELSHPEVLQRMQRSKILLHSSSYEGFSGVCLEALHAGCHVISFCRAMHSSIEHWHILSNAEEMKQKAVALLQTESTQYIAVTPYKIEDAARSIMRLFSL
ncbi:MAG TPA: glycosyltransferase family 4 protein [Chitinophagaceae bacterium]